MITFPPIHSLVQIVRDECRQRAEEGCDTGKLAAEIEAAGEDRQRLLALYDQLRGLHVRPDFPFEEPHDLGAIRAARPSAGQPSLRQTVAINAGAGDKIHGGWLGRCCGCALGKPLESPPFMKDWRNIRKYMEIADRWPLDDFVPYDEKACAAVGLAEMHSRASQRGHVRYMESDDDLRYTIMGLEILADVGRDFTTRDVAAWWLERLGAARCFTAEEAVYRNLMMMCVTHDVRTLRDAQLAEARDWMNPWREWIGAQIRADGWGLACPGNPELAAEFAWRDATLSHTKNGVYGEMYCAAMIAAAFVLNDPVQIVRAGLAQIPEKSRLADAIQRTLEFCQSLKLAAERFEETLAWLHENFGHYDPVHTINNASAVTAALLLGGRDYEKVITIAVMSGWDTDCNGATAGCICGTMLGAHRLPEKWTRPLNDLLLSEIPDFHPIEISKCARRHLTVARRVAQGQAR